MNNTKTISGPEAIDRMRMLKKVPNASFGIMFLTCNLKTGAAGQVRKIERCRLRPSMRDEVLDVPSDHYLYLEDLDTDEPKQCFKKLIRYVSFPPSGEWLKIKWFE